MSDAKSPPDLSMDEILASIRRIIAEDDHAPAAQSAASGEPLCLVANGDDDILELTEAIDDSGNVRRLVTPVASPAAAEHEEPEPETGEVVTAAEPTGADDSGLIAEPVVLAASASFAQLATLPPLSSAEPQEPTVGGRPLEDVVSELLRPLLRTWLDENLPALVERLVKAEIARITERSRTA